ncbi:MAG: guanylate kinase [Actinobacteria bacterium]|uniref:guanylate kinase n=1 Tax=freshwater metagenome TaxID=449393 RepID=A0A6J6NES1_9ZZZZ|nr:guanylate kinase [Actinomycetota bacterium]
MKSPKLLVIAGPTAVGKGTVARRILETNSDIVLSVSATTRQPRKGEVDGESYFFLSDAEFDRLIESGQMLEFAVVHGTHRYGTPRQPVLAAIEAGKNVLLEIDIQGASQVKEQMPEAITVFIAPPSWEELVRRLEGRGTEDSVEMERRLATARIELQAQGQFDHVVINDDVAKCAQSVVELLSA